MAQKMNKCVDCGDKFKTWYCDDCSSRIDDLCSYCHPDYHEGEPTIFNADLT